MSAFGAVGAPAVWLLFAALAGLAAGWPLAWLARRLVGRLLDEEDAALREALDAALEASGGEVHAAPPAIGRAPAPIWPRGLAGLLAVLAAAVASLLTWRYGASVQALAAIGLGWVLLTAAATDAVCGLLPDELTLPLLWAGLLVNLPGRFVPLADAVVGAAASYLLLAGVAAVYRRWRGREGMYGGDFKLAAALGAWLGWQAVPTVLVLASAGGLAVALAGVLAGRRTTGELFAFGPYLALAGVVALALPAGGLPR